jgi:membrane-anchored glycerophosphoryl diester phosphodiesterase (GDPDase)
MEKATIYYSEYRSNQLQLVCFAEIFIVVYQFLLCPIAHFELSDAEFYDFGIHQVSFPVQAL